MSGRPWTQYELKAISEWAGTVPVREIAERLNRSVYSIEQNAKRRRISLRCNWHLQWCSECSCWRTRLDPQTGECSVCRARKKAERTNEQVDELYALLGKDGLSFTRYENPPDHPPPRTPRTKGLDKAEACKEEQRFFSELEEWQRATAERRATTARKRLQRAREDFMKSKTDDRKPVQERKSNGKPTDEGRRAGAHARAQEAH